MTESEIPIWLKNLPLAPEYRPTETEFADPIAFISRIEQEASSFGICKVIPPLPKPSKKFVLFNLNRSLSKSPELGDAAAGVAGPSPESAVFTTRQQELGSRRARPAMPKQVWQSGDVYTVEQFEGKCKAFARSQLGRFKDVTPLLVESLFWKAVMEKPINIEYANDVPGSGFAVPEEPFRYISWRRNRRRGFRVGKVNEDQKCGFMGMKSGWKGTSGWKLSNSRWNLQVIARSPGSLIRFMPDDVPGVTSPMIYIGMLFSWFAWHVEDHELHSMNYLHMGSPKTWYAVPRDHAATLEEIVRFHGYGESVDRLAAFIMLGEKTTLLSPEVLVASGVPCCRLVQHPGEFVVTFPRAYHVGFSHGFNCGEAANFATPEWLKVAKDAAIRRAAMNHLPMLSHQQLLYILTMSFVSRIPRSLISGVRSSRLKDRRKDEREILVKKAFLTDMMNENYLLCVLLGKESTYPILWEPYMLPAPSTVSQSFPSTSLKAQFCGDQNGCCIQNQHMEINIQGDRLNKADDGRAERPIDEASASTSTCHVIPLVEPCKNPIHADLMTSNLEAPAIVEDEDDLPVGLNVDSGSLACVACGTLGYPFMAIIQPTVKAAKMIFSTAYEEPHEKADKSRYLISSLCLQNGACNSTTEERCTEVEEQANLFSSCKLFPKSLVTLQNGSLFNYSCMDSLENKGETLDTTDSQTTSNRCNFESSNNAFCSGGLHPCENVKDNDEIWRMKTSKMVEIGLTSASLCYSDVDKESSMKENVGVPKWDVRNVLLRPRLFCLRHAIEVKELLRDKGGGHTRVICHSDYLKFKAYAASIAEEMCTELHLKDVPLENASQEDLNLINISIDDEGHQEDGKDWTSKLGVNLRHSVKLRKHSASTLEQLPSALRGMFSSSSTVSISSSLRWLRKKSRTSAKPSIVITEKPCTSATAGEVQTSKIVNTSNTKTIQVYQSRKKKTGQYMTSGFENFENLFTVPISLMENHVISQNSSEKRNGSSSVGEISTTDLNGSQLSAEYCDINDHFFSGLSNGKFVSVPVDYKYDQIYNNTSASNCSLLSKEENNSGESGIDSNCERGQNLEMHDEMAATPELKTSEIKHPTGTKGSQRLLSFDSEIHIEPSITMDLSSVNCSAHCEEEPCGIISSGSKIHKTGCQAFAESILDGEHSRLADNGELHPSKAANFAPFTEENALRKSVDRQVCQASTTGKDWAVSDERRAVCLNIKSYVRRKKKRKLEVEQGAEQMGSEKPVVQQNKFEVSNIVKAQQTINGFARSPCEGLRPRKQRLQSCAAELKPLDRRISPSMLGASRRKKAEVAAADTSAFKCNIEGCCMVFGTKVELRLHKNNRCTHNECQKRFSNHKHTVRHERVHNDERPLKCSWKGCEMSFKWEWARTEHRRLHTGERPYKCLVVGCGLSFRFVSDFSRHRRKTGHFS